MEVFKIHGPTVFDGEIGVQGSKNAVLPMMAAAVINSGKTVLRNCPDISDVHDAAEILRAIGCSAEYRDGTLTVDSSGEILGVIPGEVMSRIRASFVFTGAILSRCGFFSVSQPGGCNIGMRPVDIHLDALRMLGATVEFSSKEISCKAQGLTACDVSLRFPSVGATENIMILASTIKGTTRIQNAAREPEITDLQDMLNSMGAHITGAGTSVIVINGSDSLSDTEYTVMPDRVEGATYLTAVACCGGRLTVKNADASHFLSYINALKRCGLNIEITPQGITAEKTARLKGGISIATAPYPGFATDMQSLMMAALTLSDGVSLIRENIFENRFCLAKTLVSMGADIRIYRKTASVRGIRALSPVSECVCDLRSGAALAVAMMSCEGVSELGNIHYIDRGYESFEKKYASIGARIERIEKSDA